MVRGLIQYPPLTRLHVATGSPWVQPTENSVEALLHGMSHVDGVELDLRLSTDGELMLWHDELLLEIYQKEQMS